MPLVSSFHTLGKVKNYSLARGEAARAAVRIDGRAARDRRASDRILAATPAEAGQLVGLYRAEPEHIRLVPPGVDHTMFTPRDRSRRAGAALPDGAPARAVRRTAAAAQGPRHRDPDDRGGGRAATRRRAADLQLAIVGGPSGAEVGEVARLMDLATRARRGRPGDALPAAAAGAARRLLRRGRCRPRAVALGVVRPGRARGAGLRDAGRRRRASAGSVTSWRTARPGSSSKGTIPRSTRRACCRCCATPALQAALGDEAAHRSAPLHVGRDGRRGRARVRRAARVEHRRVSRTSSTSRPSTCHSFSRAPDLRICALTCGNVGLTAPGAADTFRIAPSGPKDRDGETGRGAGSRRRAVATPTRRGPGRDRGCDRAERPQGHRPGGTPAPGTGREARTGDPTGAVARPRTDRGSVARGARRGREVGRANHGTAGRSRHRTADPEGGEGGTSAARRADRRRSGDSPPRERGRSGPQSPRG